MTQSITTRELWDAGFTLTLTDRGTILVKPQSRLTDELRERIRHSKPDLIRALTPKSITPGSETPTQETERPASQRIRRTVSNPKTRLSGGVGTELKKLIPKFFEKKGCGCGDYARQLDKSGIQWCVDNRQKIIDHLVGKATETFLGSLSETLDRYVATRWVDQAIPAARTEEARQYGEMLGTKPLVEFGPDVIVITVADDRFANGATLLAWSVLTHHRCKLRVYDLGITDKRVRTRLESWGVDIVQPPELLVPRDVEAWQTFNKPAFIRDAMRDHDTVIWLDSDVMVGGDLTPLLDTPFVPDHGQYNAQTNRTRSAIAKLFGPDAADWHEHHHPCAGVLAFSQEDRDIVCHWIGRTIQVRNAGVLSECQYHDQNILQTHYAGPLRDGVLYNNLSAPRVGDLAHLCKHAMKHPERVIHHFGGHKKPFFDWPDFDWPKPRGA